MVEKQDKNSHAITRNHPPASSKNSRLPQQAIVMPTTEQGLGRNFITTGVRKTDSGVQTKLAVSRPRDSCEEEADRIAEQVLGSQTYPSSIDVMSGGVQRQCSGCEGGTPCPECAEEETLVSRQRNWASDAPTESVPEDSFEDLGSPSPLDQSTGDFMESRFGCDFGQVRVHDDARAERSARAMGALAYTVGEDIVFGEGQHAHDTPAGARLMAHELTHVVQQRGESSRSIQRACHPAGIGQQTCPEVDKGHSFVPGTLIQFEINCDEFKGKEKERLLALAKSLSPDATMEVHGYASVDGSPDFNENLACARALKAFSVLTQEGGVAASRITRTVSHGPVPGPADERRSVTIRTTTGPTPTPADVETRKAPDKVGVATKTPGKLPPDAPLKNPVLDISPRTFDDHTPNLSISKTAPPPPSNLVEVKAEANLKLILVSTGDRPAAGPPDPCRLARLETKLSAKLKLDGVGVGDRVHLFYHEPTLELTLPLPPCQSLPELKGEVDLVNVEIVPKILEFSLKPGLTIGDNQLKPGGTAEVELKPWGKANNFLSNIKISGEVEATSENKGPSGRDVKAEATLNIGAEF